MSLRWILESLLTHPLARGLDLDSSAATRVHARLIREKPFLKRLYHQYYSEFAAADQAAPPGVRLEIGSGAGFLKEVLPHAVTMDLRSGAEVDVFGSALNIPFAPGSVGAIFMLNVLHHLPDPAGFFVEANRVLVDGGRIVMIEPFVSPLSRIIYSHLHHEPFDPTAAQWTLTGEGPMSEANDAIGWIIFFRDKDVFQARFPSLRIERRVPHTALLYLLSGGVSLRSLVPNFAFGPLKEAERLLGPLQNRIASMMTVELVRQTSNPKGKGSS
jgi:SAM-dependent methyltransferase